MYIDVLGSWDTGGRRLTINSGFSYYPSTPDFAFRETLACKRVECARQVLFKKEFRICTAVKMLHTALRASDSTLVRQSNRREAAESRLKRSEARV